VCVVVVVLGTTGSVTVVRLTVVVVVVGAGVYTVSLVHPARTRPAPSKNKALPILVISLVRIPWASRPYQMGPPWLYGSNASYSRREEHPFHRATPPNLFSSSGASNGLKF
jgi:hypothetical protein